MYMGELERIFDFCLEIFTLFNEYMVLVLSKVIPLPGLNYRSTA